MVKLLSRSLTSLAGKLRSILASPSISPSRWKKPTPEENKTIFLTGNLGGGASGDGRPDALCARLSGRRVKNAAKAAAPVSPAAAKNRWRMMGLRAAKANGTV